MSRPAGLPPRPVTAAYDLRSGNSYRPLPPPPKLSYDNQNRGDSSHRNDDTYRPRDSGHHRHDENRAPGTSAYRGDPPSFPRGGADSYRPPSSDFSFRRDAPETIDVARTHDSYRPSGATRHGQDRGPRHRDSRQDSSRQGARGRGGYRGRGGFSKKAAERPFLQTNRAPTPELMPGMDETVGTAPKYLAVEDMSDSEEADMDVSDDEDYKPEDDEEEQPKKKQVRTEVKASADGDSVPRWSNPDPYTALPPPDESSVKKKDVVKLIRKARVSAGLNDAAKTTAETDDFISFDFGDDNLGGDEDESDDESVVEVPGAPTGPRNGNYSHREEVLGPRDAAKAQEVTTPTGKSRPIDTSTDPDLGNRKRTYDDKIKGPSLVPKPTPKGPATGNIVKEWKAKAGIDDTPWLANHYPSSKMGSWLHMEIMDFFHRFKPAEVEENMRGALISDLRRAVQKVWHDADILPFGSYPAGLYLPTADMDLVFVSRGYMDGGYGKYTNKNALFRFRDFLDREKIAAPYSIEVISKAKVPLVKYIDYYTGLRVDVSFENDTGLIANKTFQNWKDTFPAMPILVTIVKQFLAMRGLNEPVNGGIGGFTVTCLVVSLLQHMPQIQSGNMIPEHHLGEILMEFFDLYGNEFNVTSTAIQLKPPAYVSKASTHHSNPLLLHKSNAPQNNARQIVYRAGNLDRFSIIDPNNSSNDISGGSHNTQAIRKAFSRAFDDLFKHMSDLSTKSIEERRGQSVLGVILGGNYSSFEVQRNHLERIWQKEHDRR
ncbi:hypothetical protein VF21_04298 [Pseudogymnoascus sp. 05NY08]|nr:hypothetical protein VF21_04298 [Pseudogymnoascus sp. 05NY08]